MELRPKGQSLTRYLTYFRKQFRYI